MMKLHLQANHEDKKAQELLDAIAEKIRLKQAARVNQTLALVKSGAAAAPATRIKQAP